MNSEYNFIYITHYNMAQSGQFVQEISDMDTDKF
jgi:hypothetical protein